VIRRVIKISPLYENLTVQFITEKEFLNAKISFSIYWKIVADFGFYFRAYNKDLFYLIRVEANNKRIVLYKSLTGGKLVAIRDYIITFEPEIWYTFYILLNNDRVIV